MKKMIYMFSLPLLVFATDIAESTEMDANTLVSDDIKTAHLSIYENGGAVLQFDNGETYHIEKKDVSISGGWLASTDAFMFEPAPDNKEYPTLITNMNSKASVHAVLVPSNSGQ